MSNAIVIKKVKKVKVELLILNDTLFEFPFDIWEYCIKPFLFSVIEFPKTCQVCQKAKKPNELHSWRFSHDAPLEYQCERCWCGKIRGYGTCDVVKHSILNIISLEAIPYYQQRANASRLFNSICDNKALFKGNSQSLYLEKVVRQAIIKEQKAQVIQGRLKSVRSSILDIKAQQTIYRQLLKTDKHPHTQEPLSGEIKTKTKEQLNINASLIKTYNLEKDSLTSSIYIKCPVVITL
jgi:hypothetical protein